MGSIRTIRMENLWTHPSLMLNFDKYISELKEHFCKVDLKYHHKLDKILTATLQLQERLQYMSVEMDNLTAQVKANSDLLDSATLMINGIADRIIAAGVDPSKLAALTAELKGKDDVLAAAVVANTPVKVV